MDVVAMSVVYVLTTHIHEDGDDATVEQIMKRAKWDNDDYVCRGLILQEAKYMAEDASSKKFLASNSTNYKITDSRPVLEQYNELLGIFGRFCYVSLLHTKDEALDKLNVFKTEVKLQHGSQIKRFRTDRGGEYMNTLYFQSVGIIHPYTPQQNGISERKIRVPNKRNMITPYELWTKRKPNLNYLSVWGCRVVVRLLDPKLKTLGERGIECIFVGYAEHSKAFRFYVIKPDDSVPINSIIESRDSIFDEKRFSSVHRPSQRSLVKRIEDSGGSVVPEKVTEEKAINDEMDSIMGNNTWVLADLPLSCKPLGFKWIFKRKLKVDGTIEKFKTRLVIQGFKQKSEIDYFETYAPMDVKTAFLNGDLDEEVDLTKEFLSSRFFMKDMREANVILVSTPMDTSEKLMPNNGQVVSQLEYSRVIGCLMYAMTCTRSDIAFAVGKLSRYTNNPGTKHWQAIQRVLRYLKKIMDYRLTYTSYPLVLEGYTDASWISNTEDNSSTSGWVFLLGGGVISWAFKKQTCITSSTMESEFVALATAGKEAEWLKNLLLEIPLWSKTITPISIRCDSAATLAKAYSQMYNGKSRHLGVRHNMIRELITNGVLSIEFVRSQRNLADYLTKGLARDLVLKSAEGMGLKSN
ncbi:zinc finger, CCHC-type containing protein [Tanacetum coccineum]